jgi:anti-anti-sigma factor
MFHGQRPSGDPAPTSASLAGVAQPSRFRLIETEIADGCREIAVEGELDLAVSGQLKQAIEACPSDQILINLEACQFIDSTGIFLIVRAHRDGKPRVVVHSPRSQVLRLLEVTGLTGDGLVFPDRAQALSTLVRSMGDEPPARRIGSVA